MAVREALAVIGILLSVIGYAAYLLGIYRRHTRPHVFSWLIWAITEATTLAAQLSQHAGPGAWITAFTTLCCAAIAVLSIFIGEKSITRGDRISFSMALAGLAWWYLTDNPLGAVILVSAIDAFAFYPTIRKSFHRPREENATLYGLAALRSFLTLFALANVTLVTALNPAGLVLLNGAVFAVVLWRRMEEKRA